MNEDDIDNIKKLVFGICNEELKRIEKTVATLDYLKIMMNGTTSNDLEGQRKAINRVKMQLIEKIEDLEVVENESE